METIHFFEQHWVLIVFVGTVIASWARYELMINELKVKVKENHVDSIIEIDKLKVALSIQEKSMDNFKEGIGRNIQEIQTTMKFILEAINEIKKK